MKPNNGMHPTRDTTALIYLNHAGGRVMPGVMRLLYKGSVTSTERNRMKRWPFTLCFTACVLLASCSSREHESNVSPSNSSNMQESSVSKSNPTPVSTQMPMGTPTPQSTVNQSTRSDLPQSAPADDLVGKFSETESGSPLVIVTKTEDGYYVSGRFSSSWSKPEKLRFATPKEYEQLFGVDWKDAVEVGLTKDLLAIFKVKKGTSTQNHTFKTGYFLLYTGGIDVYKVQ